MQSREIGIQIREAAPAEAGAISRVLCEAFVEFEALYTPGGLAVTTPGSDLIEERFAEGPIWVAERNGSIVGTVAAAPKAGALYVRSMAVLPEARGLRIGALLMEQVEKYALAHGHRRLFLSTTPFLSSAIRLYESFGFQRTDDGPHDLFGTPLFTMEKNLDSGL